MTGRYSQASFRSFINDIEVEDCVRLVDGDFMYTEGEIDIEFQTQADETIDSTLDHFGITLTFPIENKDAIKGLKKKKKSGDM